MDQANREVLLAAKTVASYPQPTMSLPVGTPVIGSMRPVVTRPGRIPASDVRKLTKWRNRFVDAFLTEFVATEARTQRFLSETVGPDEGRILFMIDDHEGRTVGQLGLTLIDWETGWGEMDAGIVGEDAPYGLMTQAQETLWRWARDALGLRGVIGRIRSDNSVVDYAKEKAGAAELMRVPLRRETVDDGIHWIEDTSLTSPELSLVYLEFESVEHGST